MLPLAAGPALLLPPVTSGESEGAPTHTLLLLLLLLRSDDEGGGCEGRGCEGGGCEGGGCSLLEVSSALLLISRWIQNGRRHSGAKRI
jgi:hypothetical protein